MTNSYFFLFGVYRVLEKSSSNNVETVNVSHFTKYAYQEWESLWNNVHCDVSLQSSSSKKKKKQRFGDFSTFSTSIVNKQPYLNCLIVGNEWHEKSMVCLFDAVLEVQWQ